MSLQDSLTIGITLFATLMIVVAIGVLRGVLMESAFFSEMEAFQNAASAVAFLDYVPLAVLFGSFTSSMYFSSRVNAKPIYLPVSIIFLMVATVVSYFLTLVPQEMASYTVFSSVFSSFGVSSVLMQNLHIVVLVTGLIGMVALYGLQGRNVQGGRRAPL